MPATEPDLNRSLTNALDTFVTTFGQANVKASGQTQAAKRRKTDIDPLYPSCLQEPEWSEADDAKAQELWSDDKPMWESIPTSITSECQGVWKDCLQLFHCTPFDIAGAMHKLRFQTKSTQPNRSHRHSTSQVWSVNFCMQLRRLVTHSAWALGNHNTRPSKLSAAIQYAVP
jgi:hypothetical protein